MSPSSRTLSRSNYRAILFFVCCLFFSMGMFLSSKIGFKYGITQGTSMQPFINDGDRLLEINAKILSLKREDIISIRIFDNQSQENITIIKRIIALPGETITIEGTQIYINGALYDDPFGYYDIVPNYQSVHMVLGSDQYFVMGDNRNISMDSRIIGPIPGENIIGKLIQHRQ